MNVGEMFAGVGGFRLGLERTNLAQAGNSERRNLQNLESEQSRQQSHNSQRTCFSEESKQEKCRQRRERVAGEQATQLRSRTDTAFRVVWANEWDKYACQIYRRNFGSAELMEGDIREVKAEDVPDIDLLCAGFPCQPHSLAGKRQGFSDKRGEVFHEITRVAGCKRPKLLLLENVKGLLSSEHGRAFGVVLEELGNIGYWCEWQTFNSKFFGVPQNRERVFIVGHLRGAGSKQIFPVRETNEFFVEDEDGEQVISSCLDSNYYKGARRQRQFCIQLNDDGGSQVNRIYSSEGLSPTVPTASGGRHIPKIAQALQTDGFLRQGSSFGTSNPQSSRNIRRLTPIECERLQGFPDNWTQGVSDTQRYKLLGNAVTVNVIQFLGELIVSTEQRKQDRK